MNTELLNLEDVFENSLKHADKSLATMSKRARAKFITMSYIRELINLHKFCEKEKANDKIRRQYEMTRDCCTLVKEFENAFVCWYCKKRFCVICNRIKTAEYIEKYLSSLESLPEPHFVTLTRPNILSCSLKSEIKELYSVFRSIQLKTTEYKRRGKNEQLVGIRKLEVTYNSVSNSYHPHFHLIVGSKSQAELLIENWLLKNKTACSSAQDMRVATRNSMLELAKYCTKIVERRKDENKTVIYVEALDTIFQALESVRIFQTMSIKSTSNKFLDKNEREIGNISKYWHWNQKLGDWNIVDSNAEFSQLCHTKISNNIVIIKK